MPRTRGLLAFAAVCLCLAQLLGCKIQPLANHYSCKNGEACPTGQSCGDDDICRPTQCTSAADCPSEYECIESMCVSKGIVIRPDGGDGNDSGVDSGPEPPQACEADMRRCAGNVPERCEDGAWKQQDPCGGATPACTNGECAKLRLHGSIVTLTDSPAESGKVRLVEQGLEYTQPSCGMVQGKRVCLSGGIVP